MSPRANVDFKVEIMELECKTRLQNVHSKKKKNQKRLQSLILHFSRKRCHLRATVLKGPPAGLILLMHNLQERAAEKGSMQPGEPTFAFKAATASCERLMQVININ